MFNWFKSKVELKNDKSIMSSFYSKGGVKLGSELVVPQNFKALIYYNEKLYYTLDAGKHKVDNANMASLVDAHKKTKKKLKNIKLVCHYINTTKQNMELTLKKKTYTIDFYIDNVNKFADLMLLYSYKVDNDYVYHTLYGMFIELLTYHSYDYKKINKTSLIDYGIVIESFVLDGKKASIFNNQNNTHHENNAKIQQPIPQEIVQPTDKTQPIIESNQSINNTENLHTTSDTKQTHICPNCNNVSKFNTAYCLKCGYKLY